jgi:TRAP-type mannitol/chloroaromatic compound transport system substrate-binding protein
MENRTKAIEVASGGRLKWKLVPAGSIVPAAREFDGVDEGVIQGGTGAIAYWKDKWEASTLFTYTVAGMGPFETYFWWDKGGGKELAMEMIEGYDVLPFRGQWSPPEAFLHSTVRLDTLDDYKGLKLRASGDGAEVLNMMGAAAIFLPGGEIYESLQRGVIDATEVSGPSLGWDLAMQEVTDYLYMSPVRQPADGGPVFLNRSAFEALPDDLKEIVTAELDRDSLAFTQTIWEWDIAAIPKFREYGTEVLPVPTAIEDEMKRQALIFYEQKGAKDPFSAKVYQSIRDFIDLNRNTWPATSKGGSW